MYFCGVSFNLSFFVSKFIVLSLLPFFLDESGQMFISFVYLLKEPAFSFIDLCYCFLHFFFKKLNSFIHYLFLAALGLCCCSQAFSSCGERGLLFIAVRGLLVVVASLVAEHGL